MRTHTPVHLGGIFPHRHSAIGDGPSPIGNNGRFPGVNSKWPVLAALLAPALVLAQYSIDWFTIDGGGGTSTNGQYSLSGTIGQPDAGLMTNGNFALQGGYWGMVASVQTPGVPRLSVTIIAGQVTVSWLLPADGWVLEQTDRLADLAAPWAIVTALHVTNASDIRVTLPALPGDQFFRLHKP